MSRDDLTDIVSAIERMQLSLVQLRTSLAGIIPAEPDAEQLPAIAANTLATLFPGVPHSLSLSSLPHLLPSRSRSHTHTVSGSHTHTGSRLLPSRSRSDSHTDSRSHSQSVITLLITLPHLAAALSAAGTLTRIDLRTDTDTPEAVFHYRTPPHPSTPETLVKEYSSLPLFATVTLTGKTLTVILKK